MYKVVIQRLDYDDFPIGRPVKEIGPFESFDEADDFRKKFFPVEAWTGKLVDMRYPGCTSTVEEVRLVDPKVFE